MAARGLLGHPFLCHMTLRDIDHWFEQQQEPVGGTLLWLRRHITARHPDLSEAWKYRMPFFLYRGRMLCYLWCDPNDAIPYVGFVDGPLLNEPVLVQGTRKRMSVLLIDPAQDVPVKILDRTIERAMALRDAR